MATCKKGHFSKTLESKGYRGFHRNEPIWNKGIWVVFNKFDLDSSSGLVTMPITLKYTKMDIIAWEHNIPGL